MTGPLLFLSVADAKLDWTGLDPKRLLHWLSVMGGGYAAVCLLLVVDTLIFVWVGHVLLVAMAPLATRLGIPGGVLYLLLFGLFVFFGLVHVSSYMTTLMGKLYRIYDNRLYKPPRTNRMVVAGAGVVCLLGVGYLVLRGFDSESYYRIEAVQVPGFRGGLLDLSPDRIRAAREFLEAAERGNVARMRDLLLEEDVPLSVGSVDKNQTALHKAILGRRPEVVRFLRERNFDMDLQDRNGNTAMHLAAEFGSVEMLGLLIEGGARLDVQNVHRQTPLHRSAWYGQRDAIRFLLQRGADVGARDVEGLTPADVAEKQGFPGVVEILGGTSKRE